ncbi:mitochondrial carrier [Sistotremastrum suecicum HHB10207 ss-3]|uniref:Mitochondrial carrier n=1 Tax=Sistotremastrum suecicum HHB10207 ss-3 TaxID=1314776 RepID=A0A166E203_9AGAM|nr:mitochondrial carrier [Sistotremastrum suecicum HHB10207 ss-3]
MPTNAIGGRNIQDWKAIALSGVAGGVAGCVAKTVVAPLDRVKILFQTSNPDFQKYAGTWSGMFRAVGEIYQDRGVRGLLQGHSATLLRIFPYAAIKFMAYDQVHHFLMPTPSQETNIRRFIAGASAGTVSILFTYPLELIRVRLAFETRSASNPTFRPTLSHVISQVYHEGKTSTTASSSRSRIFTTFPILKFYRGFSVSIIGMIPYSGTSFLMWGFLRSHFLPRPSLETPKSTPVADLALGGLSGAVAQTVSYPFEIIRRRMQVGGIISPDQWMSWKDTVQMIWNKNGWRGFYVGLSIGYVKIVPMTAVSYAVWEWGKRFLNV